MHAPGSCRATTCQLPARSLETGPAATDASWASEPACAGTPTLTGISQRHACRNRDLRAIAASLCAGTFLLNRQSLPRDNVVAPRSRTCQRKTFFFWSRVEEAVSSCIFAHPPARACPRRRQTGATRSLLKKLHVFFFFQNFSFFMFIFLKLQKFFKIFSMVPLGQKYDKRNTAPTKKNEKATRKSH